MYTCVCLCVSVCVYICVSVCVCIYIYIHKKSMKPLILPAMNSTNAVLLGEWLWH